MMRLLLLPTVFGLVSLAGPIHAQDSAAAAPAPPTTSLTSYLDSASLHASLARLPAIPAERRIEHVFIISWDSAGQPLSVSPAVPHVMPRIYADSVAPLVRAALLPAEPRPGGREFTVMVKTGDSATVERISLRVRPTVLVNRGQVMSSLGRFAQELVRGDSTLVGTITVRTRMVVDPTGVPDSARIEVSSGMPQIDEQALRVVSIMRFRPLHFDDEPVSSVAILPVVFVFPEEDPP